jgi:RND family efflux transporter MFP subunit
MTFRALALSTLVASLVLSNAVRVPAQEWPASPVRYTEAKEYPVHLLIELPGSVESRTESLVASEVAGLVVELAAREGKTVRKGETIAKLRSDRLELQLEAAEAELREAEARLTQAGSNLERSKDLFNSEVLSRRQLDEAMSEYDAWRGRTERLQAMIARIKLDIERSAVRAPFAGVVVAERCEVGEWVDKGDPVVELISLYDLQVRVDIPERYFRNMNLGAAATVRFESLPGYELIGKVSAIVPRANAQSRTFPLKIRIKNKDGKVGAGMLAKVSFPAGESHSATVVPKDAVITRGAERYVYLIGGDSTVSRVSVETGVAMGSWVEIQSEVRPGAKVVTRGNERLQPGQRVQGEPIEYALP